MSRVQSRTGAAVSHPIEPSELPSVAPSPSSERSPSASSSKGNTVEVHRAPAPSAAPVANDARGGLSEAASGAVTLAAEALTRSWGNWEVEQRDVRQVLVAIGMLSGPDYRACIDELDRRGLLSVLADKAADGVERSDFLAQALAKGLVQTAPGQPGLTAPGEPPPTPDLYVNDPRAPRALRRLVHQENLARGSGYNDDYKAYLDRYIQTVEGTKDALELRALGRPVPANPPWEPGLVYGHPDYKRTENSWAELRSRCHSTVGAYRQVDGRTKEFQGLLPSGTLFGEASIEFKERLLVNPSPEGKGLNAEAQAKVHFTLAQNGKVRSEDRMGGEVSAKVAELGVKFGVDTDRAGNVKGNVGAEVGPLGVEVDSAGGFKLELEVAKFKGFEIKSYSAGNAGDGSLSAGIEIELRGVGKVSAGAGYQASRGESVRDVVAGWGLDDGIFAPMPELDRGIPWMRIPAPRRERLERMGFHAKLWEQALTERPGR